MINHNLIIQTMQVTTFNCKYIIHVSGAAHHDDLIYLFYIQRFFPEFNETDPETTMIDTLTTTWTEFARTG